jgi:hypothetical protein
MSETRKIVRIVTGPVPSGSHVLYALCDDGTVWSRDHVGQQAWAPLPPIPQPDTEAKETAP